MPFPQPPAPAPTVYDGMSVRLTPAPLGKRFFAYVIDLGIVYAIVTILMVIAMFVIGIGAVGVAAYLHESTDHTLVAVIVIIGLILALLAILAIQDLYFIYFEVNRGATPGKSLFGLKVVCLDGSSLSTGQAVLRDLMRYIDCFLIFPGLFSTLLSSQRRRLGDYLAGTLVIHSTVRERSNLCMYLALEDYQLLLQTLRPPPISEDVRRQYLAIAFKHFISHPGSGDPSILRQWSDYMRKELPAADESVSDDTLLRFFAELCFQGPAS